MSAFHRRGTPLLLLLIAVASLVVMSHAFVPVADLSQQQSHTAITDVLPVFVSLSKHSALMPTRARQSRLLLQMAPKDTKGVYARPSAAIEKGSGFFIPGLEGPRVRLLFGIVVLVLTVLNHVMLSSSPQTTVAFPERLAVVYAILLLLQAAIEFGKEEKGYVVTLESDAQQENVDESLVSSTPSYSQSWSTSATTSKEERERVQWAAASYVSLTPATHMLLLDRNDGVVYRLGSTVSQQASSDSTNEIKGVDAAFSALDNTSSGRVSLPPTHPTVVSLNNEEEHDRCVVLQQIDDSKCFMMTSNQLLAAFTKDDLKWLGQLAKYVE